MTTNASSDDNENLEAVQLSSGTWAVRPVGQLGTCGWSPRSWQVYYAKATTMDGALRKAKGKVFDHHFPTPRHG